MSEVIHRPNNDGLTPIQYNSKPNVRSLQAEVNQLKKTESELAAQLADMAVSARIFGVVGDGVVNDSAAFINALKYTTANNKVLYVPNGIYNLSGMTFASDKPIKILGQDRDLTIVKYTGTITAKSDIVVENLSIMDVSGPSAFVLDPTSLVEVVFRNVRSDNTDNNFTNTTRANAFVHFVNGVETTGIRNLITERCDISNYASYGFRFSGYVRKGYIGYNHIKRIGYDTNAAVSAITGGRQSDTENVIIANFENVVMEHNEIEDLFSKLTTTGDTGEAHGIMCYGRNLKILHNTVKNIYGGGKAEINLNSGFDHEAIYTKADDVLIEGNTIINGSGDDSQGSIVAKAGQRIKVIKNEIRNLFGTGITLEGVNDSEITDNKVILESSYVPANKFLSCVIINYTDKNTTIKNNKLYHKRPKTANSAGSNCVSSGFASGVLTIENNTLESTSDILVNISQAMAGSLVKVNGNMIDCDSKMITIYGGAEDCIYEFNGNTVIHRSTLVPISYVPDVLTTPKGHLVAKGNTFIVKAAPSQVFNLDTIKSFEIADNEYFLDTKLQRIIYNRLRADNTTLKSVINNRVLRGTSDHFILMQGTNFNIGELFIKNNNARLANGRLFSITESTVPVVDYLELQDNHVKSDTLTDKSISSSILPPTEKRTVRNNIER